MVMRAISTTAGALRVWPEPGSWTYEDYARLPDDGYRYEVIEGELYMSPAPATIHQWISMLLGSALQQHAAATQLGRVLAAPCDVRLGRGIVVQPDLLFVATERRDIVGPKNISGAPDLVVEILSPGDPEHDRVRKHELYARHGVREYWIIDPDARIIEVYTLDDGPYGPAAIFGPGMVLRSAVLPDLAVAVDDVVPAAD